MTAAAALRALRRYLVLMLMVALAVNVGTFQNFSEWEDPASGSRPWQAEQTADASAIIESLTELDAEEVAHERAAVALASLDAGDILLAAARRPLMPDPPLRPNDATVFPHKTGPPSM